MFDRVAIRVSDVAASEAFYDLVLATLGRRRAGEFVITAGEATRNLHVGFSAPSRAAVDEFWRAGTEAGYESDGEPGPRPEYMPDSYGAFLLDPDGNSAEAVHHSELGAGLVDHVWVRVSDLEASRRFYEAAGLMLQREVEGRYGFGAFSIVAGGPTRNAHLVFSAPPAGEGPILLDPDGNSVEFAGRSRP